MEHKQFVIFRVNFKQTLKKLGHFVHNLVKWMAQHATLVKSLGNVNIFCISLILFRKSLSSIGDVICLWLPIRERILKSAREYISKVLWYIERVLNNFMWKPSWELLILSSLTRTYGHRSVPDYVVVVTMFNYFLEQLILF